MTSLPSSFPRRVRIRGGEFGASARAMHRKAALENVSSATIERKTMSTKTKFKRVALVAVAALGIGMVSAVPSQAAPAFGDVGVYSAGTQIIGGQATVYLDVDTATVTNVVTTGAGSIVSAAFAGTQPAGYATSGAVVGTASSSFAVTGATSNRTRVNLVYTSNVVGTTTVTATPLDGNGVPGTAVTKTITWISGATDASVAASTGFISATIGSAVTVDDSTAISVAATASQTSIARIDVKQWADAAKTIVTATASTSAITVSIAGAGAVQATSGGASSPSVTVAAGTSNPTSFYINANGVAGTGTITIAVAGVTIATKTVTFTGTFAAYKLGTASKTITGIGSGATNVLTATGVDALGNVATIPGATTAFSSNTAVATVSNTAGVVTVTGVAVGTATITVANNAVLASATITATFTVTVGKNTATTVTLTTDKASYAAGDKITLTVTAKGSDGTATADKAAFAAFSAAGMTSNVALQGLPSPVSATVALVGGVATYTIYAPLNAGTVSINAVEGADTDSTTKAAITTSFDVSNPSNDAAVDAANAATDAANYAADAADAATTAAQEATAAAQAAQDSADAATAAVVALGLRVDTLMASVRAQLTSLSNLLVRLIKKAHA